MQVVHERCCGPISGASRRIEGGVIVDKNEICDAARGLVERGTFAVLAVLTKDGDVVLRPIGGRWDAGIVDAVREMAERYPGCGMKLFERPGDEWEKYFRGVISREQCLFWAQLDPAAREALEELRRKLSGRENDAAQQGTAPQLIEMGGERVRDRFWPCRHAQAGRSTRHR